MATRRICSFASLFSNFGKGDDMLKNYLWVYSCSFRKHIRGLAWRGFVLAICLIEKRQILNNERSRF